MASVLSRVKTKEEWVNSVQAFKPAQASVPSVLPQVAKSPYDVGIPYTSSQLCISDKDVEGLGDGVSREIGGTTEKIIKKMAVGKFDELGAILTAINAEADKLDPASLNKGGLIGWVQKTFGNVTQQLTMKMKTAEAVFSQLEGKISDHIAVHSEWIKDLESLYEENYSRYQTIISLIKKGRTWEESLQSQIANWPVVDPEAGRQGVSVI